MSNDVHGRHHFQHSLRDRVWGANNDVVDVLDRIVGKQQRISGNMGDRVQVRCEDVFTSDIAWEEADVVLLYLSVQGNLRLRSTLLERTRPGTRLITVQFHLGDIEPTRKLHVAHSGHHADAAYVPLYLYEVSQEMRETVRGKNSAEEILRSADAYRR